MSDMAVLSPYRFTVADYHRIAESGALDDARVELIDGIIVEMSPIGPVHVNLHALIVADLSRLLSEVATVVGQGSFPFGDRNEPQPDVAIVAKIDRAALDRQTTPDQIFAIVEIANTSFATDSGPKARLYGRFGIADYLIVDLNENALLHYTEPHALGYRQIMRLSQGDTFHFARFPQIRIEAAAFLPPPSRKG